MGRVSEGESLLAFPIGPGASLLMAEMALADRRPGEVRALLTGADCG